jgi:ribosomal protein S18 acetylase RimI-like enzyme
MTTTPAYHYRRESAYPLNASTLIYPYIMRNVQTTAEMAAVHALLVSAYACRGRSLPTRGEWWQALQADPEFDARLVFLVVTPNGILAAAGIASTSGRVRELVVAPSFRRLGLGTALVGHISQFFEQQGVCIGLRVEADDLATLALCESMGMRRVEREAAHQD